MRNLLLGFAFVIALQPLFAQQTPPFWNDIVAFKKADSVQKPATHQILFVGSSSFTFWKDVNAYFPGYSIINRGFGGSTLEDLIRYAYDIILPYQPKQIVIYCGENDFASADSVAVPVVVNRFKTLFAMIRTNFPNTPIAYISMKPSIARAALQTKMKAGNLAIQQFLAKQSKAAYIDIYDAMLDKQKQYRPEIYIGDKLHMNALGYAIWKNAITPYLLK